MSDNETLIREFIADWSSLDAGKLAGYFTETGTYHNIPSQPVSGRAAIGQFITGFTRNWESTQWEILSLVVKGDVVMVERVDHTVVAGQKIDLPCVGVFELENGKIRIWRDYFDLATYTGALGKALGASGN